MPTLFPVGAEPWRVSNGVVADAQPIVWHQVVRGHAMKAAPRILVRTPTEAVMHGIEPDVGFAADACVVVLDEVFPEPLLPDGLMSLPVTRRALRFDHADDVPLAGEVVLDGGDALAEVVGVVGELHEQVEVIGQ